MTESEAVRDLALLHYPGKWKQAQVMAANPSHHPELDYWARARRLYLELGGEYVQQLSLFQRLKYWMPPDTASRA